MWTPDSMRAWAQPPGQGADPGYRPRSDDAREVPLALRSGHDTNDDKANGKLVKR